MRISFTICMVLLATSLIGQQCTFTINGHIIDQDVNTNLPNAVVSIASLNRTTVTDSLGNFSFTNICSGSYALKVTHISCTPFEKTYNVNKSIHIDITMPHSITVGIEAVITAVKERQSTGLKLELTGAKLNATRGENLATALSKINGVTLLQTGSTISKPVIHGLYGSRLLLINNGVRQEGQQWGNEHAPEVDPFLADKLSIIKGVDELKYGSDAIGGVILVEPKPMRIISGSSLDVFTGYSTNNKLYYGSAIFEQQLKRKPNLTYRIQGSYKRGANSTTPNYRLNNTGLQEYNFSGALRWKKENKTFDLFASNFNTTLGIFTGSHIGNITDLQNAIAATQPSTIFLGQNGYTINRPKQEVNHQIVKAKFSFTTKQLLKWNVLLTAQRNQRKEYDIVRTSSNKNPQLDLSVLTFSQDVNVEHQKVKNSAGILGVAAVQQVNDYAGRYFIPNYVSNTFGFYALQKWHTTKWDYQAGIRADYKVINTSRLRFNGQQFNFDFKFPTVAASANATYKFNAHLKTNFAIGLSSRAPYVNELLSDGIHHGTATYEVGDINLKSEKSFFANWNWSYTSNNDKVQLEASLYNNSIKDFIFQQPKPSEPVLTIAGAFPKIEWQQTNARLTGIDFSLQYKLAKSVVFSHKLALLYAKNTSTKDWLILMPANRMENELAFNLPNTNYFQSNSIAISATNVANQKRVPGKNGVQYDFKAAPNAYTLVNATASTTLLVKSKPVVFYLGVTNLFNTIYRDYMNTFRYFTDELGTNLSLKITTTIF